MCIRDSCNSLRNRWLPAPRPVRHMRPFSSFTPHYAEDVSYSVGALKSVGDEGVNLESLLRSLFANEWLNLCERVKRRGDSEDPLPDDELREWASDRGQVLSRTVRGVMMYGDALRVLARLEGVPDEELEALVASKFEFVVTCQIYGKLKASSRKDEQWKAQCIDDLRHRFAANLRIAYVELSLIHI